MPRKFFRRLSPSPHQVRTNKYLQPLAHLIEDPNLFHLNRHSVARAFAIGVGVGLLPVFGHVLIAGILAIWRKANLGISIILVWVSNPFTIPFFLFIEHKLGLFILGRQSNLVDAEWTWEWISNELSQLWLPLLVGGVALSVLVAFVSYYIVYIFWHLAVRARWKRRRAKRKDLQEKNASS